MQLDDPVAAPCHPTPYGYYRTLQQGPALAWHPARQLWVASRAAVIRAVLDHPHCLVRPMAEPVPPAIAGSSAGEVFRRLVRMNDGAGHTAPKQALAQALAGVDLDRLAASTRACSTALTAAHGDRLPAAAALNHWVMALPIYAVGELLGAQAGQLAPLSAAVSDFVQGLSPRSDAAQLERANRAARKLLRCLRESTMSATQRDASLGGAIARAAALAGWTDGDAILANLLGLLAQTHDATAGLIGNAIVALLTHPDWQQRLRNDRQSSAAFMREVIRYDAPIQNTRRFIARDCQIDGVTLRAGEAILLLLGAAGRDEQEHLDGQHFMPGRAAGPLPGFGHGRHACPGQKIALSIAGAAIDSLLRLDLPLDDTLHWHYRPSVNARIPQFTQPQEERP